jgi:electron transfer flavoprotein alpha subunit
MRSFVFSDDQSLVPAIATFARGLGEYDIYASGPPSPAIKKYGASKTFILNDPNLTDSIADLLASKLSAGEYQFGFIASTVNGRDVAGLLASKSNANAIAEISSFEFSGSSVRTKRFFFGGKSILEEESSSRIFTVSPGIAEPKEVDAESSVEQVSLSPSRITVLSSEDKKSGGVDIEKAQAIVSIGRGLGSKDKLSSIEPFASAINAVIAGSRPVCLDYHWLSEDRQVGLSGKKVRPKVYIALGISGQIQHIAGMRGSKIVIAVNKDRSAPIFEECDYGIVGDMFDVLPKLMDGVKK